MGGDRTGNTGVDYWCYDRFGMVAYRDSVSIRAKWKFLILPLSYRSVLNLTIDDIVYVTGDDVVLQLDCISRSI